MLSELFPGADKFQIYCDECGSVPAHPVESWDKCPTDRGTEIRYYTVNLCAECAQRRSA